MTYLEIVTKKFMMENIRIAKKHADEQNSPNQINMNTEWNVYRKFNLALIYTVTEMSKQNQMNWSTSMITLHEIIPPMTMKKLYMKKSNELS